MTDTAPGAIVPTHPASRVEDVDVADDAPTGPPARPPHKIIPDLLHLAVPLENLTRLPGNPRRGDVEAVARSFDTFGQRKPLVGQLLGVDERGKPFGIVEAGNHGADAAELLGWSEVAVAWVDEGDEMARAFALADNRTPELGGYDEVALAEMVAEARDTVPAEVFAATGYTPHDLEEMIAGLGAALEGTPARTEPDAAPDVPEPDDVITARGDVWLLGRHRVACDDCTDPLAVARLFAGVAPVVICTDPPYCSGGFQESGRAIGSVGTTAAHKQVANDRLSTRGYMALIKSMLVAAKVDHAYIFTDWRMWVNLFDAVESSGYGVRSMVVWDKQTPGMGRGWRAQHEIIMWAGKATAPFESGMTAVGNVVQAKRTGNPLHTTQKPVELLERLLAVADFATTVYDPFAGSGSTLIAAESLGREFFGMELDAAYVDVICRRFQEHTGVLPVLERTGEPRDFTA